MDAQPKTKRPRGRPALGQDVRDAAFKACGALLAESGLEGMKARNVAKRTGLSIGSIYKMFGDIDDLIREINLETYALLEAHHRSALDAADLPESEVQARLMVLAKAYIEFIIANERRWMALLSFNRAKGGGGKRYAQTENALYGIIETVLAPAPGFADARFRARAARALWASVHGIVTITLPNKAHKYPVREAIAQIDLIVGGVMRDAARSG